MSPLALGYIAVITIAMTVVGGLGILALLLYLGLYLMRKLMSIIMVWRAVCDVLIARSRLRTVSTNEHDLLEKGWYWSMNLNPPARKADEE